MDRFRQSALSIALSLLATPSTDAAAQVRTLERSRLPRGIDSALRIGALTIVDSTKVSVVRPTTSRIQLRSGQLVAARTGEATRIVRRPVALGMAGPLGSRTVDTLVVLPFSYIGVGEGNRLIHLQPVVIRDSPFRYEPEGGLFRGSLLVGLQDSLAPTIRKDLEEVTPLTLVSEGNNVAPRELRIASTNYPLKSVVVMALEPRDSVSVRVIPAFDTRGTIVWVPVRPALAFDAPKRTSGLGIQTASFLVSVIGVSLSESVTVTLAVDGGSLKENRVKVGPTGSATVHLRSRGTSQGIITARSPGIDSATTTIDYVWPFGFLVAALLGGVVGGATRHLRRNTRRTTGLPRSMLLGLLVGLVAAVLYYALDINVLRFSARAQFFDEAAVFGIAMLASLFGLRNVPAASP